MPARRSDENLDEAERARRQLQRQKQGLALKLRAEGKTYKPQKSAKASTKIESGLSAPTPASAVRSSQKAQNTPQRPETGTRPDGAVQVIIVPIFWNKKADEKETVISAAQQVQQQLQTLGIEAGLDDTNADTPGQKYRYWEQQGVKVRVELGPRDVHKAQALLAITTIPGQVAKKSTHQLGPELSTAVQSALAASGIVPATQPGDPASSLSDHPTQSKKKQKSQHKEDAQLDSKAASQPEAHHGSQQAAVEVGASKVETAVQASAVGLSTAGKAKSGKRVLPSGDDLGDEFSVEIEDTEDVGSKKKKTSLLNAALPSNAAAGAGGLAAVKGKKNKHKVVSF